MSSVISILNSEKVTGLTMVKGKRIKVMAGENLTRNEIVMGKVEVINALGKLTAIRWDTLSYLRSGAMRGVNQGTLAPECYKQEHQAEKLIVSVFGSDPSCLEPGYYSKTMMTPLQAGWIWNPATMDWYTDENTVDINKVINPRLIKFTADSLIKYMPEQFKRYKLSINRINGFDAFLTVNLGSNLLELNPAK